VLVDDNVIGQAVVTVTSTDVGFKTQGCGIWSPLPASGPQSTRFGDGAYAVGVDIAPGTYTTSGGGSCYWERESDLTGGIGSIIVNSNATGETTVSIDPSDKGFKTQGCGTWTKTG
jgi:hypothetical protein